MEFGKWLWRLVITIIVIFMVIAAYRLSTELLKSRTLGPPTLAQVSLLDGTILNLQEITVDQDLITVAAPRVDIEMSWDGQRAAAQLVIDPRKLPVEEQIGTLYKWLVAVPREGNLEKNFCISVPEVATPECYPFSRTPTVVQPAVPDEKIEVPTADLPTVYPRTLASVQNISEDRVSLFVTLQPYDEGTQNTVNPRELFIRVSDSSTASGLPDFGRNDKGEFGMTNEDQARLNGYPFIQLFLKKGISVKIEGLDRSSGSEVVYDVYTIPQLIEGAVPLKGSAPLPSTLPTLQALPTLNFIWLGTEKTALDEEKRIALDQSELGRDFSTRVTVKSNFQEPVKVVIQLLDITTIFSLSLAPSETGEVMVNIKNLSYGSHQLQMNAILPNGTKTADVVIPFEYRATGWL